MAKEKSLSQYRTLIEEHFPIPFFILNKEKAEVEYLNKAAKLHFIGTENDAIKDLKSMVIQKSLDSNQKSKENIISF